MAKRIISVKSLTFCALMAALCAICSQISVPLPFTPIPVNLGTFAVFMAGALLGGARGGLSLAVYACIGAVGLPVFSRFSGGIGVLLGPTGGYIIGYVFAAIVCGFIIGRMPVRFAVYPLAMLLGLAVCYLFGTAWYIISAHVGIAAAIGSCVLPFLPGDALKIILASLLAYKLRRRVTAMLGQAETPRAL